MDWISEERAIVYDYKNKKYVRTAFCPYCGEKPELITNERGKFFASFGCGGTLTGYEKTVLDAAIAWNDFCEEILADEHKKIRAMA